MAPLLNVHFIFVALLIGATFQSTEATEYSVGDSTGWIIPSGGSSFYSNWASQHTFRVGDVLVFNFVTGRHDVTTVTRENYDNCNYSNTIEVFQNGQTKYTLNGTGDYYFICAFPTHCSNGQKLAVKVSASSPAPGEAPSEGPSAGEPTSPTGNEGPSTNSPTTPGSSAPPPSGSAPKTQAAAFSVFMAMFMYLFFHF